MLKRFVKRFSYLAFSIICIFSLSIPCLAVATSSARMANIDTARCSLEVSDQSVAANARVTGKLGAEKCKIVLEIQEQQGTRWVTVDSCTVEESARTAKANSSIKAEQGVTYRAQATVTVWLSGASESKTVTTQVKTA